MTTREGERRKLVFINLANGASPESIMSALKMSRAEVERDFQFVAKKIRAYRFARGMPFTPCTSVAEARANKAILLHTVERLNLDVSADHEVKTLPFDVNPGGNLSEAEQKMLEMRLR